MAVVTYKCPNCDGPLTFSPERQRFVCDYCLSAFTQQELDKAAPQMGDLHNQPADTAGQAGAQTPPGFAQGQAAQGAGENPDAPSAPGAQKEAQTPPSAAQAPEEEDAAFDEHAAEYICPSCGAQVVCEDATAATYCYYCHNPVVLAGKLSGDLKPDRVVPFEITREQAMQRFAQLCSKKWFAPRDFCTRSQLEKMAGVYFPFWLVGADAQVQMSASAQNVRTWRTGDIQYTETSFYQLEREGYMQLADLPILASLRQDASRITGVYPYDLSCAKPFHMAYLSGFMAQKREVDREKAHPQFLSMVNEYSQRRLRETCAGYTSVQVQNFSAAPQNEDWEHTLLPVWTLTYTHRGKTYCYTVNGQNGKICGKVPLSGKKLLALFFGIWAGLFALCLLGGWLL